MTRTSIIKIALMGCFLILPQRDLAQWHAKTSSPPEAIALHEAEILIYLLPNAKAVRAAKSTIGWELQTNSKLNQEDYYTFWVYDAKRPAHGSVTIGYFAVNKHTADVWDDQREELITSKEIEGVQKILRRAHHIEDETIRKYQSRPLWALQEQKP